MNPFDEGAAECAEWQRQTSAEPDDVAEPGEAKQERKSASTVLVELAQERYAFGVSTDGETYGVPLAGPKVVLMLRGGKTSLRGQLAKTYFARTGRAAPQQALADALLVLEGMAQERTEARLYMRTARAGGALWLDLGDQTGRAVRVTSTGWTVVDRAPVLFRRTALNGPLPEPEPGGDLNELWKYLNVASADRPLVVAWLVSVLYPEIPHPVLGIFGEQGTGKTTAQKVLVQLLDPGPVPTRKPPKDPESWVTAAAGSWVVGLDNLSDVPPWLSDSICRGVTGDGDVRRKLYTDGELAIFAFRRCIAINGIDLGALRGDLAERLLPIDLARISDADRLAEEDLWPAWEVQHPRILGALLDLVAGVLATLPSVRLETRPRMADFARILAALDTIHGTAGLACYVERQAAMATDSLTDDPFVIALARAIIDTFKGTAAEVLARVTPPDPDWRAPKGWPTTARGVTARLRRQAPPMRKAGWTIHDDGAANHDKVIRWTIARPPEMAGNQSPPSPQHPRDGSTAGHAGVAGYESGPSQDDGAGRRVQVVAGKVPDGAVYIGRAFPRYGLAASPFANPHRIGKPCTHPDCAGATHDRGEALGLYRQRELPRLAERARIELVGAAVACWCPADLPCHGDLLLAAAQTPAAMSAAGDRKDST